MKKLLILLLLLLPALTALTGCEKSPVLTEFEYPTPAPEQEQAPAVLNPLTHLPVASEADLARRIFVVSIDNYREARPQAGVSTADLMYEVPAEGGISRLLAVFFTDTPEMIGPVRSARPYMVDVAREWQGVFVHCGGSDDALNYLSQGHVNWLNEMSNGAYFWRESGRNMPHNLFTASEKLYEYLERREWPTIQIPREFIFYETAVAAPRTLAAADIVHVDYPYAKNIYEYDAQTGLYARSIGDEPHLDVNNDAQVQAANIIIQRVSSRVLDSEGRLSIDLVGEGEAMLFTGGTVQTGTWRRTALDGPTYYYDQSGGEFVLNAGQTWIQICDGDVKISYEDSSAPVAEDED